MSSFIFSSHKIHGSLQKAKFAKEKLSEYRITKLGKVKKTMTLLAIVPIILRSLAGTFLYPISRIIIDFKDVNEGVRNGALNAGGSVH